ncbi:protein Asi1 [Colletotrichum tofieldiae]|uniref:Protein Asi1 n=1 Tax=Colletotrichum tofieldiae TaxID=708197 RepID=A0A166W8N0_9PEZI|nr:protein Asi1 [Colletotrichum tofieldiae]GKT62161.1 protein Asi1 [Colletotrichum tofieldiae]GKT69792.1 protein Asi1 [Colletotrichum tofieldiae]GKT92805.1 protein Asi1 [Colletotrichum tofieldiae]
MDTPHQPVSLDNPGVWQNLSLWTAYRLQYAVNVTKLTPSLEDLVWAGPRMVRKLTAYLSFPDSLDALGQRVIPEATGSGILHTTNAATTSAFSMDVPPPIAHPYAAGPAVLADPEIGVSPKFTMEGAKGLGSVFSYATSKWALCCIAMAIVLNRTHIFAATRRRLRLTLAVRLLLRGLPILLFLVQARGLLRSIQCQTSPDFSEMRWGNTSKSSELMFSQAGGFLHTMSSTLLLGAADEESCTAVGMVPANIDEATQDLRGSLSLLWPLFGTFCLSQFLETVSCAVQGRPVAAETGMTLFEHSLAFAEADAAISNQLGWGLFTQSQAAEATSNTGGTIAISRSMILRRVNTSPEVLLIAFLSAMSHITSHVLGIFNLQAKFRLVSTGFWGLCFMASILWSTFTFSLDDPAKQGLLRFPTVCIIGFIPHVLVLGGILVCLVIYLLALGLAALTPTDGQTGQRLSLRERLAQAHANMQANLSLSDIRISMEMDFYTALLRTGFGAITMASEAVYLNEDRDVTMRPYTWLEEERYRELEELRTQWIGAGATESHYDTIGTIGLVPVKDDHMLTTNGYARERAAQKVPKSRSGERRLRDGVGAAERSGRWLMALDFIMNINRLIFRTWATAMLKILSKIGLRHPKFLLWVIRRPKDANDTRSSNSGDSASRVHAPADSDEPPLNIPRIDGVDVESEFRQQAWRGSQSWAPVDEADLDSKLYGWWLRGGWWGSKDNSGEYQPYASSDADDDDDTTSVVSFSTNNDSEWELEEDGQRTPTQTRSWASREATPTPEDSLQLSDLARLLHPSNPEEREEAHALAAHLNSDRIMTRSQYRRSQQLQRTRILQPAGRVSRIMMRPVKMTPDEEAQRLEQLLLSRRAQILRSTDDGASTWAEGAAGLGPDGPQCVVCQSAPRTIIVWPCRCLSLCDDCRVSLAMNNFDKCVCCRREVISFSRIYVP